jgi:F-type H+-transporting ATPase subunit b
MRYVKLLFFGLLLAFPVGLLVNLDVFTSESAIPWGFIGRHAFNLALLLTILTALLRKPIANAVKARAGNIRVAIDEAQALRKDAEARYEMLEGRLARFESEMQQMKADATQHAEQERDAILSQAQREAQTIKAAAEHTIRDETARARRALQQEAVLLAMQIAEERLRSQVATADNQRLTREVLDRMNAGKES